METCKICGTGISDIDDFCEECFNEMHEQKRECEFCSRPLNNHAINCPENDSPFALLVNEGYD
jgi:predicted amidophosphoribosyltransferase